jgi:hypothetical protein
VGATHMLGPGQLSSHMEVNQWRQTKTQGQPKPLSALHRKVASGRPDSRQKDAGVRDLTYKEDWTCKQRSIDSL